MTLGHVAMVEALGWAATAVVVGSYFCTRSEALVRTQMAGALMWAAYGVLVRSPPVLVANVLVLAAAGWKNRRPGAARTGDVSPRDGGGRGSLTRGAP